MKCQNLISKDRFLTGLISEYNMENLNSHKNDIKTLTLFIIKSKIINIYNKHNC